MSALIFYGLSLNLLNGELRFAQWIRVLIVRTFSKLGIQKQVDAWSERNSWILRKKKKRLCSVPLLS